MELNDLIQGVHPTLVEVYAPWCPHCRRMMPVVEGLKELYAGRAHVVQIDGDGNPAAAEALGVQSFPTWVLFKQGREVWRDAGEMAAVDLEDMIERYV